MNILVLADIHSNWPALESVFNFIRTKNFRIDHVMVLGDIIGYGPYPNQCVEFIQSLRTDLIIAGNHEWALLGKTELTRFNFHAREGILFTRKVLSEQNLVFLSHLGGSVKIAFDDLSYLLVHGSPRETIMEYILNPVTARINLDLMKEQICLFGHTHIPVIYMKKGKEMETLPVTESMSIRIRPEFKYLINPGSIGQPRDSNPKASFGMIDTKNQELYFYRVPYNVHAMIENIQKFELPVYLGERLLYGL